MALFAVCTTSCQQELPVPGEDGSKPVPQEILFDGENCTDSTLAIRWDASDCIRAGAVSFTIQTCPDLDAPSGMENYDNVVTKTVKANDIQGSVGRVVYEGKSIFNRAYVRIRANYKNSVFSAWNWAKIGGNPAQLEVGYGMVDATMDTPKISFESEVDGNLTVSYDAEGLDGTLRLCLIDFAEQTVLQNIPLASGSKGGKTFEGLRNENLYQVCIRQEKAGSPYNTISEWAYAEGLALDEESGEKKVTNIIQIGKSDHWVIVNGVLPSVRLKTAYSGMLVVEWSFTGFNDAAVDKNYPVEIALYEDEKCTKLAYGWTMDGVDYNGFIPSWTFANLKPATKYYFVCTEISTGLASKVLPLETLPFDIVTVGEPVDAGEMALAENFSELHFGSNSVEATPCPENNKGTTVYPTYGTKDNAPIQPDSKNHGFFNTLGSQGAVQTSRFKDWGVIHGLKDGTGAVVPGDLCIRTGMFQMGASSGIPQLYTPELTNLQSLASVEVSFVMATMAEKGKRKEYSPNDFTSLGIYVATGGSTNTTKSTSYGTLSGANIKMVDIIDRPDTSKCAWETRKVIIRNVAPGSRIGIGAIRPEGKTGNQRWLLREVMVKVLSYSAPDLVKPELISVEKSDVDFTVTFAEQEMAQKYELSYKECGASAWVTTVSDKPILHVEGLKEETEYHVRAVALAGEYRSEETTIVVTTDKPEKVNLSTPIVSVTPSVKTAELTWEAVDQAESYSVYLKSTGDFELVKEGLTDTGYTLDGLNSASTYTVGVKAFYKTNISEMGTAEFTTLDYTSPTEINKADTFVEWLSLGAPMAEAGTTLTLTDDLDLSGMTLPEVETYAGTLIGNGKKITISNDKALFKNLTGIVKDLTIAGTVSLETAGNTSIGHPFATLAYISTGTIENVTNLASVTISSNSSLGSPVVAGIVAYQEGGKISRCTNNGAVSLTHSGTANVAISGMVRKPFSAIGGIVGFCYNGEISDCVNSAKISVKCNNVSNVSARHYIGGIVGTPENATVTWCRNDGDVVADFDEAAATVTNNGKQIYVGGIIGGRNGDVKTVDGGDVSDCTNNGKITLITDYGANNYLGGICGQAHSETLLSEEQASKMTNCINNGELVKSGVGGARTGGISGGAATLDGCINNGKITVNNNQEKRAVGGLVGYPTQTHHSIKNCKSLGDIECKAGTNYYIGGIGGQGGNTTQNYEGCTIKCNITTPTGCKTGMILGTAESLASGRKITCGTSEAPIKVSGSINETTLTADNFSEMLIGNPNTNGGEFITDNVQFGE